MIIFILSTLVLAFSLYMSCFYQKRIIRTQEKQISVLNEMVEQRDCKINYYKEMIANYKAMIDLLENSKKGKHRS